MITSDNLIITIIVILTINRITLLYGEYGYRISINVIKYYLYRPLFYSL